MADLKISELPELLPFDSNTQVGGISNSDYIPILDQDETDITLINKKVRVSTLFEFIAPIDTPVLTGTPFSTTPPPGNNSTRIATTAFVQNELNASLTLNSLQDVTNPTTPEANQILVFDDITGTFVVRSSTTTNREILLGNKILTTGSALYQFLDPNGSNRDVILPVGVAGIKFTIKNLDVSNSLNIKESAGGTIQATIDISSPVADIVHDGTEYHIMLF